MKERACSACLLLKAPLVASELVTSQISSICSRVLRSLLSISAGIRTSRVPCLAERTCNDLGTTPRTHAAIVDKDNRHNEMLDMQLS